ncbi:hypothetical protein L1887_13322 [Cichorium endivia]|nr:hypothetical protein L1887_13322 [Cichorium endivia]
MAEKIYPDSKPTTGTIPVAATGNPSFPASKAQLYNTTRLVYSVQSGVVYVLYRSCLWITFIILMLIVVAAIAGGVVYVLYRPHRPSFSVSSIHRINSPPNTISSGWWYLTIRLKEKRRSEKERGDGLLGLPATKRERERYVGLTRKKGKG